MAATNGGSEADECDVRIDFSSGKGTELGIQQAWRGKERQVGSVF